MPVKFSRRNFLVLLAALPLTGCTARQIRRGIATAGRQIVGDVVVPVLTYIPAKGVAVVDQLVRRQVQAMVRKIVKHWNDDQVASERVYVKYTDQFKSRAIVDFDRGLIRVETVREQNPRQNLKKAIVATLLTPEDPRAVDLLSDRAVTIGGRPFLYRLVVDQDGEEISETRQAERYADYLLRTAHQQEKVGRIIRHFVSFAMVREHRGNQRLRFHNYVLVNARRFNQPVPLIFAIIEAESSFNPFAMSHVPAYGLMQIVPASAGRDVHQLLYNRPGTPTRDYLFIPANNIQMGVAYLHILNTRYLQGVTHPLSRQYCVIAGYNTGSGNVLAAFYRNNRTKALKRINRLPPREVYSHLVRNLPFQETRDYLSKVVRLMNNYQNLA